MNTKRRLNPVRCFTSWCAWPKPQGGRAVRVCFHVRMPNRVATCPCSPSCNGMGAPPSLKRLNWLLLSQGFYPRDLYIGAFSRHSFLECGGVLSVLMFFVRSACVCVCGRVFDRHINEPGDTCSVCSIERV